MPSRQVVSQSLLTIRDHATGYASLDAGKTDLARATPDVLPVTPTTIRAAVDDVMSSAA